MNTLLKLELNKLLKEYEYLKSDYEYQSELIRISDMAFLQSIDSFLNRNEELKVLYQESVDMSEEEIEEEIKEIIEDRKNIEKDSKIKSLFREIVKVTHPDKTNNTALNNFYIQAKNCYETNDVIGIYKICDDLSIDYEINDNDLERLKETIDQFRNKISFIKNKITWKWVNTDEKEKEKIAFNYIKSKILK
jgi:hypothetical protein